MKKSSIITISCAAVALIQLTSGCGKSDQPGSVATEAKDATKKAIDTAVTEVKEKAAEVKDAAQKTIADVKQQASDAAAAVDAQVKSVVEQAKGLIAEKKYSEALDLVKTKLSNLKLTSEQQQAIDSLKEQIQKAIASINTTGASKAAGDLLKPKN